MNTINNPVQTMLQNLAVKATAMKSYRQQKALTTSMAFMAHNSSIPADISAKMYAAIHNANEKAYRQLRSEAKAYVILMEQQISAIKSAQLTDKRQLLDALPIIHVPVGAAFLGIAEADLHQLNSQNRGVFGDIYMGRRCNSMNELLLIAQNPGWLSNRPDGSLALKSPDSEMLYAFTYVDLWTAVAYTNMSWDAVQKKIEANGRYYRYDRTYRVSDLETFRMAKLKAKQQ